MSACTPRLFSSKSSFTHEQAHTHTHNVHAHTCTLEPMCTPKHYSSVSQSSHTNMHTHNVHAHTCTLEPMCTPKHYSSVSQSSHTNMHTHIVHAHTCTPEPMHKLYRKASSTELGPRSLSRENLVQLVAGGSVSEGTQFAHMTTEEAQTKLMALQVCGCECG
jgi:hypothetical protein